jgi:ribosome biogenesis GTPase
LVSKYPLSAEAKQAKENVKILQDKGIAVGTVAGSDEMVENWRKTADEKGKKGSVEGAQALASLVRHYARQLLDERTKKVLQAPNYSACAAACDRLLDESAYNGKDFSPAEDAWKTLKTEILYQRGQCELASVGALPATGGGAGELAQPARATQALWKPGDILRTFTRGTLKQFDLGLASLVAPGDEVELIVPPTEGEHELVQQGLHGILTRAFPRRNELRRLHPSGRSLQTICANLDRVYVMASAAEPEFRPGFVDRVLVCAESCGLPASLIFNKIDLGVKPEDEELLNVYRGLGLEVLKISVADIDAPKGDYELLKERLAGTRSVLTGHSGVGKSSLILALAPSLDTDTVPVGEVSGHTGKGIHTTTHARLFRVELGDGKSAEVVDTPGVREFMPADTDRRNLWAWFPEIARLQGQCAYSSCTHTVEKDCAVLAAVARGEIHPRRHQSYARIYETLPV